MRVFITVLWLLGSGPGYTQSIQKIEQELLAVFKQISSPDSDSSAAANQQFSDLLLDLTAKHPNTLRAEFSNLVQEGLYVAGSDDGLFRVYSWDTKKDGGMHQYNAIFQYKAGNKLVSEKARGQSVYFSRVFTLKHEEKVWYLGLFRGPGSSSMWFEGMKIFALDDRKLDKELKLFKTPAGMQNEITFDFNMLKTANNAGRNDRLMSFDESDKKLHIPVLRQDGKSSNHYVVYVFNGEYFEKLKD